MTTKLFALACTLLAASASQAQWTQWTVGSGGNDHYYMVVDSGTGISWTNARNAAAAMIGPGGAPVHLSTNTSAAENTFVHSLLNASHYYQDAFGSWIGPWLGGFQDHANPGYAEPAGGWTWVTGETWSYTNWSPGEPNEFGPGEDFLHFFGNSGTGPAAFWNDIGENPGVLHYYMVESEPVPEPATAVVLSFGVLAILVHRRR